MNKDATANGSTYLFDTRGLKEYSSLSGNEAAVIADLIEKGVIIIFNRMLREFKNAYEDEAYALALVSSRRVSAEHRKTAAAIADSDKGKAVNAHSAAEDFCAAGIACAESLTVITSAQQATKFYSPLGVSAVSIAEVLQVAGK